MKTYTHASESVVARCVALMKKYHLDLSNIQLRVDVLMVSSNKPGPVLKLHGRSCAAIVRIVSLRDRVKGGGDAEIVIAEAGWMRLTEEEQDGLLDHELYHIELKPARGGGVARDTHGRPKLAMVDHDYEFGWFDEIARRHGDAAPEVRQARSLFREGRQSLFAFIAADGSVTPEKGIISVTISAAGKTVEMTAKQFSELAKKRSA